jgi:hypothetical protein
MGMEIKRVMETRISEIMIPALGLDPSAVDLFSEEALAANIRRAASFGCPCPARELVSRVGAVYEELPGCPENISDTIKEMLETMISYGDLQEHPPFHVHEESRSLFIYASPPSFIRRKSGGAILIGIVPDNVSVLPDELEGRVEFSSHIRRIPADPILKVTDLLQAVGVREMDADLWLKMPDKLTSRQLLVSMDEQLDTCVNPGELLDGRLIDSTKPVNYYWTRWVPQATQTGRFIYRRKQIYGAELWCYVEMQSGAVTRLLDLPTVGSCWRGYDEAWYLQAAIDSERGTPQEFRVREGVEGLAIVDFFLPVPSWARRRLDAVGTPLGSMRSLFSYSLPANELEEESSFLQERLWMKRRDS